MKDIFLHIRLYTNLAFWRRGWEIERSGVSDESLWPTLVDNAEAASEYIEDDLRMNGSFDKNDQIREVRALADDFMIMFTDERARDMSDLVPNSVPSGLDVED